MRGGIHQIYSVSRRLPRLPLPPLAPLLFSFFLLPPISFALLLPPFGESPLLGAVAPLLCVGALPPLFASPPQRSKLPGVGALHPLGHARSGNAQGRVAVIDEFPELLVP